MLQIPEDLVLSETFFEVRIFMSSFLAGFMLSCNKAVDSSESMTCVSAYNAGRILTQCWPAHAPVMLLPFLVVLRSNKALALDTMTP